MLGEAQPSFSSFAWIIQYQTPIENSRYATAFRNGRTILSFQMVRDDACHWRLPGEASSLPSSYQSIIVRNPCAVPNHSIATIIFWVICDSEWRLLPSESSLHYHPRRLRLQKTHHQIVIGMHRDNRKYATMLFRVAKPFSSMS